MLFDLLPKEGASPLCLALLLAVWREKGMSDLHVFLQKKSLKFKCAKASPTMTCTVITLQWD